VSVSGISGVMGITAGFSHTCDVLSSGAVECWGNNDNGALGNATSTPCASDSTPCSLTPVPVSL
jgi:alpha-tubulin suppressor-like RCC1 family protein